MKKSLFVLFLLLQFTLVVVAQKNKGKKQPKTTTDVEFTLDPNKAEKDAEADLKNGVCKMLTMGHPMEPEYQQRLDETTKMFGYQYISIAGCIVDENIVQYADKYNAVVHKHLTQKIGKDWEACQNIKLEKDWHRDMLQTMSATEISEQYILLSGSMYFEKNSTELTENNKKFLEINAKGVVRSDELRAEFGRDLKMEAINIYLVAYMGEGETAETAQARAEAARQYLIEKGIAANRIIVKNAEKTPTYDCNNCPIDMKDYQYRVVLDFEENNL